MTDGNQAIIDEFRANDGRVGGNFTGAPMALVHHVGRRSGRDYVVPTMYLAGVDGGGDEDTIFVFASKAGAPDDPEWYRNLIAAGHGVVEVGTETYPVQVRDVTGDERDRVYAEQARRYPGFGEYEVLAREHRTIPVLALRRSS